MAPHIKQSYWHKCVRKRLHNQCKIMSYLLKEEHMTVIASNSWPPHGQGLVWAEEGDSLGEDILHSSSCHHINEAVVQLWADEYWASSWNHEVRSREEPVSRPGQNMMYPCNNLAPDRCKPYVFLARIKAVLQWKPSGCKNLRCTHTWLLESAR